MFGSFRLFLALLVLLSHFSGDYYYKHFGYYAVRLFFVMSGLVITKSLHEIYAFDLRRFWINRALRLLPLYYSVLLMTLVFIFALPSQAAQFTTYWARPNLRDILLNAALLPMTDWDIPFRIIMPAWSIAVETLMYAILSLFAAKKKAYAYILLTSGVAFHASTFIDGAGWSGRYFEPYSATLSFSLGALIYFWNKNRQLSVPNRAIIPLLCFWLANMFAGGTILPWEHTVRSGFYANTIIGVLLVSAMFDWRPSEKYCRVDRYLGSLAYPVFLCHWVAGFAVATAFSEHNARGPVFTLLAAAASLLLAVVMAYLNECLVEPLRQKVRCDAKAGAQASVVKNYLANP